ncbi:restriction endonuclease subunit S [Lacticaseibacillus paracasei]|uniref:restriction endonuclease subunit S n=1 Tax=Lacticaseibacillus paracasei TaxID=1597 RepID=UPI001BA7FFF0|nr:restriction endonuclease subunit S [Lacticaseibacillus paracasei]MBS0992091.1 restriction endonuclease subunit S [Lacticaseibacillus paracasei]
MSKDAKNVPALRFKGYSDAWEKRKLGEVADIVGGGTPSTSRPEYWNGEIDWYAPAEIGTQRYVYKSRRQITELGLEKSSAVMLPANKTILFTSRAGIGNAAILTSPATTNQGFQSMIVNSNTDTYFLYSKIPDIKHKAIRVAAGSTFLEISGKSLSKIPIKLPIFEEQVKIGRLFLKIDNLIAATQHKIDALEQAKKVLLQRLFDQSWRFKDYSDPWEKRKFKNLVVRVNKTSDNSTIPSVEFEDIISKQGRLNKDVRLKVNSKQGIYFEPQDVLFGKLRPYLQNWLFPSFYGRAVGDFWVLRANSSLLSEYLFVLIQSPRFQSVANISSGTKMPRSDWNTVSNTSFSIPVQSEQRRIEQLFNVLDDLIAATQSRLSSLELLKKFLLQNLFI